MTSLTLRMYADSRWPVALGSLGLLLAAILGLFYTTAAEMVGIWARTETFAHAFLVPPIVIWLVWRQRAMLAAIAPRPRPWIVALILLLAAIWLASDLALVNVGAQFALVGMIVFAVPAVLGLRVANAIAFPLAYLFFAVPFGEFAIPWMMRWTADFTVLAVRFSGIPVFREGQSFVIPNGTWSVVQACSGVRYLIASFMVGTLFAYLTYRSIWRRLAFMMVALLVPIVANWVRAYMIVMLGYLSDNRIAVGIDHVIYGWIFFGIVVTLMYAIGARWSEPQDAGGAEESAARAQAAAAERPAPPWASPVTAIVAALLLALPAVGDDLIRSGDNRAGAPVVHLPAALAAGWQEDAKALPAFTPSFVDPRAQAGAVYRSPKGVVGVYIAYYRNQTESSKFVTYENMIVRPDDATWNALHADESSLVADGATLKVQGVYLLRRNRSTGASPEQMETRRLHWVDGRWYGSDAAAKIANMASRVRGHGDDGAEVLLYTDGRDRTAAERVLQAFAADNLDALDHSLRSTQAQR